LLAALLFSLNKNKKTKEEIFLKTKEVKNKKTKEQKFLCS
jgi:hypothetical protein